MDKKEIKKLLQKEHNVYICDTCNHPVFVDYGLSYDIENFGTNKTLHFHSNCIFPSSNKIESFSKNNRKIFYINSRMCLFIKKIETGRFLVLYGDKIIESSMDPKIYNQYYYGND